MGRPLAIPTLALLGGIFLWAGHLEGSFLAPVGLVLLLPLFWRVQHLLLYRLLLFLVFFFLGGWAVTLPLTKESTILPEGEWVRVEGEVDREPTVQESGSRILIQLKAFENRDGDWLSAQGKVLLFIPSPPPWLYVGESIRFQAKFSPIRPRGNPGERKTAQRWLYQGVFQKGTVRSPEGIVRWVPTQFSWRASFHSLRVQIATTLAAEIPSPEAEILQLLLLGAVVPLSEEVRDSWSGLGIAHLLSISGIHFGFVALLFASVFGWILRRSIWILEAHDIRKWVWAFTLFPSLGYLLLSGMPISAVRTFLMLFVYAAAWWIGRQSDLWSCFWAAAFGILLLDPQSLFDLSFQLSFGAVGSILLFQPIFFSFVERFPLLQKGIFRSVAQTLCVSFIIFLTMTPLTAHAFHRVSPWSLLANLIFVPWIGFLVLPLGLLGVIAYFVWSPFAKLLWHMAGFSLSCAQVLVERWSQLPGGIVESPSFPVLSVLFGYAGLAALLFAHRYRILYKFTILSFALSGLGFVWHREIELFFKEPEWEITFLNVGQGDSSFIATPQGEGILIDGGTQVPLGYDTGEEVVAPFLGAHPWARLTTVIATHWDVDHIGGLAFILENFPVRELWIPPCPPSGPFARTMVERARDQGITLRVLSQGNYQTPRGTPVEVLYPPRDISSLRSDNDCSLVFRLQAERYGFLFTGDIESSGEELLLRQKKALSSTVLKVPHHGSRSSSSPEFVAAVRPRFAIFSVGYLNRFQFPNFEVVRRYLQAGSQILRTDLDGAITFQVSQGRLRRIEKRLE